MLTMNATCWWLAAFCVTIVLIVSLEKEGSTSTNRFSPTTSFITKLKQSMSVDKESNLKVVVPFKDQKRHLQRSGAVLPEESWVWLWTDKWKHVSVNYDASEVWAVNEDDLIYYRSGFHGDWQNVGGQSLKQISVSGDGMHVWGVNVHNLIYYRNGLDGYWQNVPGSLVHVSVSYDGSHVWGVGSTGLIYYRNGLGGSWKEVLGDKLTQIEVSGKGHLVFGVNEESKVLYRLEYSDDERETKDLWSLIDYPKHISYVSVNYEATVLWAVDNWGFIHYRYGADGPWTQISGGLAQISISGDGTELWGRNKELQVHCYGCSY